MPPSWQTLQFPFTGGISQKVSAEYTDPNSRLLDVVNGTYAHDGAIEKRTGLTSLLMNVISGDPAMGSPVRLFSRSTEVALTDGAGLYSYSPQLQQWNYRNSLPEAIATRQHILSNSQQGYTSFTVAESTGGLRFIAYRTWTNATTATGDIYVSIYDTTTGVRVGPPGGVAFTNNGINYNPRIVSVGTRAYLFWGDNAHNLWGAVYNAGSWSANTAIVTDIYASLDVVPYSDGTGILIAYAQQGAGLANARYLRLESLPALTISASAQVYNAAAGQFVTYLAIKHDATLARVCVAFNYVSGGNYTTLLTTYNTSFGVISSAVAIPMAGFTTSPWLTAVIPVDASNAIVMGSDYASGTPGLVAKWNFTNSVNAWQTRIASHGTFYPTIHDIAVPLAEPFRATVAGTTRVYLPIASGQPLTATTFPPLTSAFLLDITNGQPRVAACAAARQIDPVMLSQIDLFDHKLPVTTGITSTSAVTYRHTLPILPSEEMGPEAAGSGSPLPPNGRCFQDLVQWDFSGTVAWQQAESSAQTYMSGGVPAYYEGTGVREIGFLESPFGSLSVAGVGGFLGSGVYGYAFVFADQDGEGLIWRSAPFFVSATTSTATSKITCSVGDLSWSGRFFGGRGPVLEVYRTAVNGTAYQFVGAVACNANDPGGTLTFVDGTGDATIAPNPPLYTSGGILASQNPPSLRSLIVHQARLCGIDDIGFNIYFSTPFAGGPESGDAPYFNDVLTLQYPHEPLTALASLDDKLVLFSANTVRYVVGNFPDNTGANGNLQLATTVPTPTGATDWRSIVLVPAGASPGGLMFQSPSSGIYLLDRGLSVTFIGKDVQDLTAGQTITSATLVPSANQARFALSNGYVLTYDYVLGRWARNQYFTNGTVSCAVTAQGIWYAAVGTRVGKETSGSYFDVKTDLSSNGWITSQVILGPIKPGGLQGQAIIGQVQGIATWLDPCDITMLFSYDYRGGVTQLPYVQSNTFAHSVLAPVNPIQAQWAMWPNAQRNMAESLAVVLSDSPPADGTQVTGQGVRWLGIAADVLPLGRFFNYPSIVSV